MPYKRAAGSGAASETVSGGHFDNDEYIYKATARRMINIHKQTDTIAVLLTTVGLAQVCPNKSLAIIISCCTSSGKPPLHLYI